jgi:ankyrin repeat protein
VNDLDKALLIAVEAGDAAAATEALRQGANVDARAGDRTALMVASLRNSVDVMEVLLTAGADLGLRDILSFTALILAAMGLGGESIRLLLANGADANVADRDLKTPLMWMVDTQLHSRETSESVKLLVDGGAAPNSQDSLGRTALMWAATGLSLGAVRGIVLKSLVDNGVDVNKTDVNRETAMFSLVRYIDFVLDVRKGAALIKVLLDAGAEPNARNAQHQTPLDVVPPNNPLVIDLLKDLGFTT